MRKFAPPKNLKGMIGVYEIHFDRPYKHAKHYMGMAEDIGRRERKHRAGHGAKIMKAVVAARIGWEIVRVWACETVAEAKRLEKKIKGHSARLCPICTEAA